MILPDHDLAWRLDSFEAKSDASHAATQAQLYPETGAASLPVAGGYAIYCGRNSPLNRACGLGMSGPVTPQDLEALEAFYREHSVDPHVRICPHAHASLPLLLADRGYTIGEFMNVYARPLRDADAGRGYAKELRIRVATPEEARKWFELAGAAGDWAEPDRVTFMVIRTVLKPGAQLYLAWLDEQPVGGGGLEIHDDVAALMAAETLPAYRRRGIHAALVSERLSAAGAAGCDVAMVHTVPGAASRRNVLRAGFRLLYTTVEARKALAGSPDSP